MTKKDLARKIARELNDLIVQNYGLDNSMFNIRVLENNDELTDEEFTYEGVYGGIEKEFINTIYHILEQEKEAK